MKLFRDEAVVLRTHKLGEADRIITLLTRYHGQVRAVARGVRKTTSRIGARLEPFGVVDVQIRLGRAELHAIEQVETLAPYGRSICADYPRYTAGALMLETLGRLTVDEPSTTQHYHLTVGALHALSAGRHHPTAVLDSYLLRVLAISGWAPSFSECALCGVGGEHEFFNITAGGAVCASCCPPASQRLSPQIGRILAAELTGDWSVIDGHPPTLQPPRSNCRPLTRWSRPTSSGIWSKS